MTDGVVPAGDPDEVRPLTDRQRRIWAGQRLDPDVPLYNMAHAFTIDESLDPEAFHRAFTALVSESDALRTVIDDAGGEPIQRVVPPAGAAPLLTVDLSTEADPDRAATEWVEERARLRLDLGQRLYDAALLRLGPTRWVWFLLQHHLVTDAWSVGLLLDRQGELYRLAVDGTLDRAADTALPRFADLLDAEAAAIGSKAHQRAEAHWSSWRDRHGPFTGEPLRFYGSRPTDVGPRTVRVEAWIDGERADRLATHLLRPELAALSPELGALTFFHTVLFTYLHRVGGGDRIVVGSPFHNRATRAAKRTPGLSMNLVPVAATVSGDDRMVDLADRLRSELFDGLQHGRFPASDDAEGFEVVLNYLHVPDDTFAGTMVDDRWVHPGAGDRGHALRLQVRRIDDTSFRLYFDVKTDLFDEPAQRALVDHVLAIIDAWLDDIHVTVGGFGLQSADDRDRLVARFNDPSGPPVPETTVVDGFEAVAARQPDTVAVTGPTTTLTYGQLDARADRLADRLRAQGVGRGDVIGVVLERDTDAVVAILGVLKSGAAYLPAEPSTPTDRLAATIEDAQVGVVCTDHATAPLVAAAGAKALVVAELADTLDGDDGPEEPATGAPRVDRRPDDAAYVIFTSGSTGRPKGVPIDHRGLANYVAWAARHYVSGPDTEPETRAFALFTSLAFDLTVTSIFVPLLTGGSIVAYPDRDDGAPTILDVWNDDRVDVVKATPSHLAVVRELGLVADRLRVLIVGGEDFGTELARAVQAAHPAAVIYNEYGPTETVVGCMIHRFDPMSDRRASVPIGRPAANAEILILDPSGWPVPPGVIGEIHIGGPGVSNGYLGRPELNADRFVARPATVAGGATADGATGPLFRTGDLARWRLDGDAELEFLGRADHQVKIRGHRVELGEIEAALAAVDLGHGPALEAVAVAAVTTPGQPTVTTDPDRTCERCGLPSTYPGSAISDGVCALCRDYDTYRDKVDAYFRTPAELREVAAEILARRTSADGDSGYDCVVLLSGGKDSTYMLYQVVALGLRPLVFTLDNGFISPSAIANCRRVCADLGVDLEIGSTPHMNEIFRDSLDRFSNVCNGCFKTIYTLSMNLARRHGIATIVTGLARGQLFETRLSDMYDHRIFDVDEIDRYVLEARKAYHRIDDAVSRHLDVSAFADDAIFDEITFVDFYRYVDVSLDEVLGFLDTQTPWVRPADTGRSTNCLINDVGIHVHQRERGFHNYALPYSWDVRLGHKEREAALDELDDDIDTGYVNEVLVEIGYRAKPPPTPEERTRLVAHYQAAADLDTAELHAALAASLPGYMIPSAFVRHERLPLTANGKIDRAALAEADTAVSGGDTMAIELDGDAARAGAVLEAVAGDILGPAVDLGANFFDLGGDSISAIQIVTRVGEAGVALTPRQLFEAPTLAAAAAVATWIDAGAIGSGRQPDDEPLGPVPLTPTQTGMLFHCLAEPLSGLYEGQIVHDLDGRLDPGVLAQCWDDLVARHPALRATFSWDGPDEPRWRASDDAVAPLVHRSWVDHPEAEAELDRFLIEDRAAGFDLRSGPCVRAALIDLEDRAVLVLSFHHIALDGWSIALAMNELLDAHQAAITGRGWAAPERRPVARYSRWVDEQDAAAAQSFWTAELAGVTTPTGLPGTSTSQTAASSNRRRYGARFRALGPARTAALTAFAQRERVTPSTVLQGAWGLVLSRHDRSGDVVFGVTTSGRPASLGGADSMIGMLVTTLPTRVRMPDVAAPGPWLRELQARQLGVRDHEYASLVDIQSWSDVPPADPLVTSILVIENFPDYQPPTPDHVGIEHRAYRVQSNYPLSVIVLPGDDLTLKAVYDPDQIDDGAVEAALDHLDAALTSLVSGAATVGELTVVGEAESTALVRAATGSPLDERGLTPVPDLIAARARTTPEATAVACGERALTYRELIAGADRLAEALRTVGVGPGSVVGIALERSVEMITAIVGVHRAGGAYLPLDPAYPGPRLRFMTGDARATCVVTGGGLQPGLATELGLGSVVATVDGDDDGEPLHLHLAGPAAEAATSERRAGRGASGASRADGDDASVVEAGDPAYVIYTSGSTGRPNGVPITHGNLAASTAARFATYDRSPAAYLLLSSFSFDSSVAGIFWTLASGGCLVLPRPGEELDLAALAAAIEHHRVTHTLCLPSLYSLLLDAAPPGALRSLTDVIVAGEACPRSLVTKHGTVLDGAALFNEYGPTEGTVWCTVHRCAPDRVGPVPIGRPIPGSTVAVLDHLGRPAGIGVPGEIHVAGAALAAGYHDRPDVTAQRFATIDDRRWFRTGDIGTVGRDGSITFEGRADAQVKIRGVRIELGEVEATIEALDGVAAAGAVVVDGGPAGPRLVASVQPSAPSRQGDPAAPSPQGDPPTDQLDTETVRAWVRARLPEAYVPLVSFVDELPRLPNGKIDRAQLAAAAPPVSERPIRPPETATERQLAAIWQELLPGVAFGIDDDFFDIGGHSLLAVSLVERIRRITGSELPLASLLATPTIAALATRLDDAANADWQCLVPLRDVGDRVPLYLVPPAAGTALSFRDLTAGLDGDQPLYCFEPVGTDGTTEPHDTVEAMAARYLDELRTHRPDGRYRIGGSCLGAIVAWEMARRLEEAGTPVELLVFLDPGPPHSGPGWTYTLPSRKSPLQLARDVADHVAQGTLSTAVRAVWRRNRFDRIGRVHYRAQLSYVGQPLRAPILWLQSEELATEEPVMLERWRILAGDDLTPIVVPGTTHDGLMSGDPEQNGRMIEHLDRALTRFDETGQLP